MMPWLVPIVVSKIGILWLENEGRNVTPTNNRVSPSQYVVLQPYDSARPISLLVTSLDVGG